MLFRSKRLCCRCGAIYRVDSGGPQEEKEACVYHWGRCFRGRVSRERYNSTGSHSAWTCCQGKADEDGCSVAVVHVTDTLDWANMRGFVSTLDKGEDLPGRVFALDCEMCNTTRGNELTRVTVVDHTGEVCYESLYQSSFTKESLTNSETGVYIGCATLGGISVADDDIGPFTNIGSFPSGNSGRVSHALGLRGPCFTIDAIRESQANLTNTR